jgi:hypothetical protein
METPCNRSKSNFQSSALPTELPSQWTTCKDLLIDYTACFNGYSCSQKTSSQQEDSSAFEDGGHFAGYSRAPVGGDHTKTANWHHQKRQ